MRKLATLVIVLGLFVLSCEGKRGPMGPQGEPGPGTRIVYQSTGPIPTNDLYTIDIPEIHIADMPLVTVYVTLFGLDLWYELPAYFENYPDFGQICFYTEGHITFQYCGNFVYKVVIVR